MKRLLLLMCCFSCAIAQSDTEPDYEAPVLTETTALEDVLSLIEASEDSLFLIAPTLAAEVAGAISERASAGVDVYVLISGEGVNTYSDQLNNLAKVKLFPQAIEDALLVADYEQLAAGPLLYDGASSATLIEVAAYEVTIVDQLRLAWQTAAEYGNPE